MQKYQVLRLGKKPLTAKCWSLWILFLTGFVTLQEFKNALKEDTVDYAVYTANIKRKRPAPRKGVRYGRIIGGDDDEDYSDEEWGGGARKLSNSGRKSYSSRRR